MAGLFDLLRPRKRTDRIERALQDGEAQKAWQEALAANPESATARESLAALAESDGDAAAALAHYQWLQAHDAARPDLHRAVSRLQALLGDLAAAAEAREAALRLADGASDRLVDTFELARLHRQLGDLDAALTELTSCATLDPNWPDVQRELGYLHLQRAEWALARRAFEDYLARAPGAPDREAVEHQAAALAGAPEPEEAKEGAEPTPAPRPEGEAPAPPTALAPVVVLYGLQGGVGRSTLAANLAVWLAQRGERVALVDLAHPAGELALHFDLHPSHGLAELARELGENRMDWLAVSRATVRHASGVNLLLGSTTPITTELVTDTLLQRVLPMLQLNYSWILVDAPADVGERTITLLERARLVLLVAAPDPAGYHAMRAAHLVCETLHLPTRRRRLVWHATRGQPADGSDSIVHRFPAEIHRFLSYAGDEFRPEIRSGQLLVLRKPQHRWVRELAALAEEFAV